MCDHTALWNYPQWNTQFYHQYMQQHARMTQWIQNLHQNLPLPCPNSSYQICNDRTQTYNHHNHYQNQQQPVMQQEYFVPQHGYQAPRQRRSFRSRANARRNSHNIHHRRKAQTSVEYEYENEVNVQEEDDEEEEGELVLNVDAILAFRATKEESEKEEDAKSEESFELLDAVLDENFEFVELDDAGQMQQVYGKPKVPDTEGDVEYDREARIIAFGDKADKIAGLETSLEIMFDHINDLHQPVVYPHM